MPKNAKNRNKRGRDSCVQQKVAIHPVGEGTLTTPGNDDEIHPVSNETAIPGKNLKNSKALLQDVLSDSRLLCEIHSAQPELYKFMVDFLVRDIVCDEGILQRFQTDSVSGSLSAPDIIARIPAELLQEIKKTKPALAAAIKKLNISPALH